MAGAELLSALAVPVQFDCKGVSVYTQVPTGTASSVQVRVVMRPLHPEPIVCSTPEKLDFLARSLQS